MMLLFSSGQSGNQHSKPRSKICGLSVTSTIQAGVVARILVSDARSNKLSRVTLGESGPLSVPYGSWNRISSPLATSRTAPVKIHSLRPRSISWCALSSCMIVTDKETASKHVGCGDLREPHRSRSFRVWCSPRRSLLSPEQGCVRSRVMRFPRIRSGVTTSYRMAKFQHRLPRRKPVRSLVGARIITSSSRAQ